MKSFIHMPKLSSILILIFISQHSRGLRCGALSTSKCPPITHDCTATRMPKRHPHTEGQCLPAQLSRLWPTLGCCGFYVSTTVQELETGRRKFYVLAWRIFESSWQSYKHQAVQQGEQQAARLGIQTTAGCSWGGE